MPREFSRGDRVSSQIQRILAELIQTAVKDPRLDFVTVHAVEVSRDLAVAKVFVSVLKVDGDPSGRQQNLDILAHAAPFLRKALGRKLRMRSIPELRFVYDDSVERGMAMDRILDELKQSGHGAK